MTGLTIIVRTLDIGHVLALAGVLDLHTSREAREAVQTLALRTGELLVIDLGAITFCDSSGIAALVVARNRAIAAEADIAVAAVPAQLARVFGIVGLDQVFPSHSTVDDAVTAWSH